MPANTATLRLEGHSSALESVAKRLTLRPEQRWNQGEPRSDGTPHRSSGYCVTVADAPDVSLLVNAIRVFVTRCKERAISFPAEQLRAELAIAFAANGTGINLSATDLKAVAECGIALSITAHAAEPGP